MTMEELVALITSLAARAPLTMVAIDGPSGSGKSTLSAILHRSLPGSQLVDIEHFYTDIGVDPPDGLSPHEAYEQHVDWQALDAQVLRPLRRREPGSYRPYDWIAEKRSDSAEVRPEGIVLVDGVYSMRPELMDAYDLTVYVDTPPRERTARLASARTTPSGSTAGPSASTGTWTTCAVKGARGRGGFRRTVARPRCASVRPELVEACPEGARRGPSPHLVIPARQSGYSALAGWRWQGMSSQ